MAWLNDQLKRDPKLRQEVAETLNAIHFLF
jgi:sensor domain CHASE-containing protein